MNGLDWLILGILLFSALHAASQGFVFELLSLLGVVFGYLLAAWKYPVAAHYLAPYVKTETIASGAGFLIIFVGVVIFTGVAGRIARWAATAAGLKGIDRLLGAIFGLLRGALIVVVLVMAMASFLPLSHTLAESFFAQYFLVAGRGAIQAGPVEFKQKFNDGMKMLDREHGPGPATKRKSDIL